MKRTNRNNFISEVLKDLRRTSKYLNEAYMFDDDMEYGDEMERPEGGMERPDAEMMRHEQRPHDMQDGDSAEEQAMHAQEVIRHEPIIAKIRETAIDGLKKYSENPTSSLYEFFKKVFLESDKVLTDTGENKK